MVLLQHARLASLVTAAAAALVAATGALAQGSSDRDPRLAVNIDGCRIYGTVDEDTPGVRQFLGVPFAKPPLGDLRFSPPQPAELPHELDATALPPSCMQYLSDIPGLYTRDVLGFNLQGLNKTGSVSEDCLSLGVWTPLDVEEDAALPVLVFVYGGAFKNGGIDVPYQLPPQWVQRTQEHIVVTFNYRVNIFGFPAAAGLDEQNLGFLDQRLAVEWVRDNIAKFGGDPARIVLWGQSAGAVAVGMFSYAYDQDPIVKGLIMDSGTEYMPTVNKLTYSNFSFVAENVGCGDHLSPRDELACMRKTPADKIESFLHSYGDSNAAPAVSFLPTVDDRIVFANYTQRASAGKIAKIVSLTTRHHRTLGSTNREGVHKQPRDVERTLTDPKSLPSSVPTPRMGNMMPKPTRLPHKPPSCAPFCARRLRA